MCGAAGLDRLSLRGPGQPSEPAEACSLPLRTRLRKADAACRCAPSLEDRPGTQQTVPVVWVCLDRTTCQEDLRQVSRRSCAKPVSRELQCWPYTLHEDSTSEEPRASATASAQHGRLQTKLDPAHPAKNHHLAEDIGASPCAAAAVAPPRPGAVRNVSAS